VGPLAALAPLPAVLGFRLINQKGAGVLQLQALAGHLAVVDLGDDVDRDGCFADTAAIMTHLDLEVTADTAAAHLAGALGVRVWLALAAVADWDGRIPLGI
jgi:hypothetical protein